MGMGDSMGAVRPAQTGGSWQEDAAWLRRCTAASRSRNAVGGGGGVRGGAGRWGGIVLPGGGEGGWWSPKAVVIPGANRVPPLFLQCLRSYSFKISKIIVVGDLAVGKTCLINR